MKRKAPPKRPAKKSPAARAEPKSLLYKVIELSTVDEGALEETVNRWVGDGWKLDGVQFAMRESSRRPAMAFVFFTRLVDRATAEADAGAAPRSADDAERHLMRLAGAEVPAASSAYQRLIELAEGGDE